MTTKTKTRKSAPSKAAVRKSVAKAIKAAPKNPALDKALAAKKPTNRVKLMKRAAENTTVDGRIHISTIDSPCKVVWDLADSMPKATRKEVMAAAMKKGVAFYTARTQYQLWTQASKEDRRRRAEVGL